jgi:hypothetical protein
MTKAQIIQQINAEYKTGLNNFNTSYSSINKSKKVWWLNIPVHKFDNDVNMLLSSEHYILWLYLPKNFTTLLSSTFKIRQDKNVLDLEISADKSLKYLMDIKSGGKGFNFEPFVKEKIPQLKIFLKTNSIHN